MAEFEALIKGRAELKDAKSAFDSFKQQIESNTIKLKFDLSGLSVQFNNLQRQFNQQGSQAGQYFINGFRIRLLTNPNTAKGITIAAIVCKILK